MAANIKTKGFRPTANPEMARAMFDKRISNAAKPHDPSPKRLRTRGASKTADIRSFD